MSFYFFYTLYYFRNHENNKTDGLETNEFFNISTTPKIYGRLD